MAWNANGLIHHQHELQPILDTKSTDVCLVSETHFTNQSFIRFRGYKLYHSIHPENIAKRGSAVIIKERISHYEEEKYKTEEIQATAVTIKTKHHLVTLTAV
jgi:exonuclease III